MIKYFNGGYYNNRTEYYGAGKEGVHRLICFEDNPPPSVEGMCSHFFTRALHEPGIIKRAEEIDKGWEYDGDGRFAPPTNRPRSAPLESWPEWYVVIYSIFAEYRGDDVKDKNKYNLESRIVSVDNADPHLIHADLEYVLDAKVEWIDLEATLAARAQWFAAEKARQDEWERQYESKQKNRSRI